MKQPRTLSITLFALLVSLLSACNSMVFDDTANCPQGVYVKLFSKTPCQSDTVFLGKVAALHLFAFNDKGILVAKETQRNVMLDKSKEILVNLPKGAYSFIAWAGDLKPSLFQVASLENGKSSKEDVLVMLKSNRGQAVALGQNKVWQGSSDIVIIDDPALVGSQYKHIGVNVLEKTNRIHVEVNLHPSVLKDSNPSDFQVEILSANSVMTVAGSMPLNAPQLSYPATSDLKDDSYKASFSTMDLRSGHNNIIRILDTKNNRIVWEGDLLGSILFKNPNVNFNCEHDFNIRFVIKDKCLNCGTYICWAIYVNNWLIHSYSTNLGEGF